MKFYMEVAIGTWVVLNNPKGSSRTVGKYGCSNCKSDVSRMEKFCASCDRTLAPYEGTKTENFLIDDLFKYHEELLGLGFFEQYGEDLFSDYIIGYDREGYFLTMYKEDGEFYDIPKEVPEELLKPLLDILKEEGIDYTVKYGVINYYT